MQRLDSQFSGLQPLGTEHWRSPSDIVGPDPSAGSIVQFRGNLVFIRSDAPKNLSQCREVAS